MYSRLDNILLESEIEYLYSVINNPESWVYNTMHNKKAQYFDSLRIDQNKLKNYYTLITENGKYIVKETGINIISPERQLLSSKHVDECEISYITYLNDDFEGGDLVLYDSKIEKKRITPKAGLTIMLNHGVQHKVDTVLKNTRYSVYTFLNLKVEYNKTLI
jgi:predicted 2-oxoglutarate/Fe(II)-dependent dioxygenase YbiX